MSPSLREQLLPAAQAGDTGLFEPEEYAKPEGEQVTSTQDRSLSPDSEETVNYYDVLGLDRDESTAVLRDKLLSLRLGWASKAARAGSLGEQARTQLALVDRAKDAFVTDDARELYDLTLVRKREPAAEARIDWLTKAWNYYFVHDDGAASVASRKAREQDPNNALAYVVEAWVKLRQGELRQAKDAADEAFVLDELGEDTCDVHHVRGVVFHNLRDSERAIQSFERALVKASPGEVPELKYRIALSEQQRQQWQAVRVNAESGLSQASLVDPTLRRELEELLSTALIRQCDVPSDSARSIQSFDRAKGELAASAITEPSKAHLISFVEENLARHKSLLTLRDRIASLEAESQRLSGIIGSGGKPGIPLAAIGIALVGLLLAGVWAGFLLVTLGAGGYAGYVFYKLSAYNQRAAIGQTLAELRPQIAPLEHPRELGSR